MSDSLSGFDITWQDEHQLFGDDSGFYNYAPSSILEDGIESHFYCVNKDPYEVYDYIGLTQIYHSNGTVIVSKQLVLSPETNGIWQHVAGVWNGSSNSLTIYINGEQAAQKIETGNPNLKDFGGFRVIGGSLIPGARCTFNGKIDEVRVSKIARNVSGNDGWNNTYTADADTVDLYHFDSATDPPGNPNVFDSAPPQQNGYTFDFADTGKDLHMSSRNGFGECHNYGNSVGTGSRSEFFPTNSHNVLTDQITVEGWINLHHIFETQTVFSSQSALMNLIGNSLEFTVFFSNNTSVSVATATNAIKNAFDEQHACDPAVVKGQFLYDSTNYSWAMFYLGEDVSPNVVMHNQIGVAFANSLTGPWKKWSGNPIIPFASYNAWGVGQACAISLDAAGQMILIYGKGTETESKMIWRELDISDMSAPVIGPENAVLTNGLTSIDGSPVFFNNANFAYDTSRGEVFVSRARHPNDTSSPDFISSELQIASINYQCFLGGTGSWNVLGHINSDQSGFPRNHNSGILRNGYGYLPENRLTVIFTVGIEAGGMDWLWSYRLHSTTGLIPEPIILNLMPFIVLIFFSKKLN